MSDMATGMTDIRLSPSMYASIDLFLLVKYSPMMADQLAAGVAGGGRDIWRLLAG